jgi:hypothetical protein
MGKALAFTLPPLIYISWSIWWELCELLKPKKRRSRIANIQNPKELRI